MYIETGKRGGVQVTWRWSWSPQNLVSVGHTVLDHAQSVTRSHHQATTNMTKRRTHRQSVTRSNKNTSVDQYD